MREASWLSVSVLGCLLIGAGFYSSLWLCNSDLCWAGVSIISRLPHCSIGFLSYRQLLTIYRWDNERSFIHQVSSVVVYRAVRFRLRFNFQTRHLCEGYVSVFATRLNDLITVVLVSVGLFSGIATQVNFYNNKIH